MKSARHESEVAVVGSIVLEFVVAGEFGNDCYTQCSLGVHLGIDGAQANRTDGIDAGPSDLFIGIPF